jgi:type I restriction enzyme S subunit
MEKGKQTYKLPVGWVLVKLENISKQITDGSHNPPKSIDSGVPMLSARNIENGDITFEEVRYITSEDFEYENQRTKIEVGDVLLTIVATIGRTAVVSSKTAFTLQRSVAAIKPLINSEFLMYCFQSPLFQKQLIENAKGTAQKGVYLKTLRNLEIPIAPLKEQERIVSKIETLFSELDQAEKGLEKAQQQLKVYRHALLKSAFEGKLTHRDIKLGKLPIGWKVVKVSDISNVVRGGSPRPAGDSKYYDGNIPFLKVKDITKDEKAVLNTYEFTIKEAGLRKTRRIKPKTLLLSNSGATLGVPKLALWDTPMVDL